MGPGDADVAQLVKATSRVPIQEYPVNRLIRQLRSFQGTVLCFNSFMAHLCHFLGKPAVVIHKDRVPYGYDCSVIHNQVVLSPINAWDIRDVLMALGVPVEDVHPAPETRYTHPRTPEESATGCPGRQPAARTAGPAAPTHGRICPSREKKSPSAAAPTLPPPVFGPFQPSGSWHGGCLFPEGRIAAHVHQRRIVLKDLHPDRREEPRRSRPAIPRHRQQPGQRGYAGVPADRGGLRGGAARGAGQADSAGRRRPARASAPGTSRPGADRGGRLPVPGPHQARRDQQRGRGHRNGQAGGEPDPLRIRGQVHQPAQVATSPRPSRARAPDGGFGSWA